MYEGVCRAIETGSLPVVLILAPILLMDIDEAFTPNALVHLLDNLAVEPSNHASMASHYTTMLARESARKWRPLLIACPGRNVKFSANTMTGVPPWL